MSKTIKIPNDVHTELKVFVASKPDNIEDVAGLAIMEYLKINGHKFVVKPNLKPKK